MAEFICTQCGECCIYLDDYKKIDIDFWRKGELTEVQIKQLLEARKNFPVSTVGCEMLIMVNGQSMCLIHKLFGYDKKPEVCKKQPFGLPEIFCFDVKNSKIKSLIKTGQV